MAEGQDSGIVSTQRQASTSVLTPEPIQKDVIHQTVNCVYSHLDKTHQEATNISRDDVILGALKGITDKLHVMQEVAGKDRNTVQMLIDRLDNHDAALSLLQEPKRVRHKSNGTKKGGVQNVENKSSKSDNNIAGLVVVDDSGDSHNRTFAADVDVTVVRKKINNSNVAGGGAGASIISRIQQTSSASDCLNTALAGVRNQSGDCNGINFASLAGSGYRGTASFAHSQASSQSEHVTSENVSLFQAPRLQQTLTEAGSGNVQMSQQQLLQLLAEQRQLWEKERSTSEQAAGNMRLSQAQGDQQELGYRAARGHVDQDELLIPTFNNLQRSEELNARVNKRYAELEQTDTNTQGMSELQSFLQLWQSKQKSEKNKVKWPQDYVYVGPQRTKPTYERLNECQWFLGFLKDRQAQKDPNKRENMIAYCVDLMQDAVDFGWQSAKGAHFVLVNRLIEGSADWADLDGVQKNQGEVCSNLSHS